MAHLLYRLGRACASKAWTVIIAWVVVLAAAAGAFLGFGGALATTFSIPGTETERVTEELAEALPELTGASGQLVLTAEDDTFSAEQQSAIADMLSELATLDGITGITNPFTTEAERAAQAAQITDGASALESGISQLDAAQSTLDMGQAQLDAALAGAQAAGAPAQVLEGIAAQQAQLDAGRAEITAGREEIALNQSSLADAQALLGYADGFSLVSEDGSAAIAIVAFEEDAFGLSEEVKNAVVDVVTGTTIPGVTVNYDSTIGQSLDGLLGIGEVIGLIIAMLVLLIMMRAILPAMTPVIASLVAVGGGVLGSLAFSGSVDMQTVTPVLGVMLGLAVGIDYSLFILNRHRTQLRAGVAINESIGLAVGTAGNAVVFAGLTVILALAALLLTGIPFLGVMGVVGAACVAVAVIVAITLTPALLGLLGNRALNPAARRALGTPQKAAKPLRAMSTGRAIGSALLGIAVLLVAAIPMLDMRLGLPVGSSESEDTPAYMAYSTVADEFGAGQNGPLLIVASADSPVADENLVSAQAEIAGALMSRDSVAAVAPIDFSAAQDVFVFQLIPADGPTSESTETLVKDLRGMSAINLESSASSVEIGVAGQSTANIDVSEKLAAALPIYLVVVVGLSLLILMLVFRSILVPLVATGGYILSLVAALGSVTAIYQWGWLSDVFGVHDPGPILSFAPIVIMGVLFGLAMDYQLFLVSGMREAYAHGVPARLAVTAGVRSGRAVVTAAAIIMVSVFGGFVFSHIGMVRPIGFGLAIGVLFDAFIVRMLIMPAVMHLLGKSAWWIPKWLERILPDVDVEGASLERSHEKKAEPEVTATR